MPITYAPDYCLACRTQPTIVTEWERAEANYSEQHGTDRGRVEPAIRGQRGDTRAAVERRQRCPAGHEDMKDFDLRQL